MIIDKALQLCDDQAVTTANSNVIDLGAGGDAYEGVFVVGVVTSTLTGALTVTIQTDDVQAMTNAVTLATFSTASGAAAGTTFGKIRLPFGMKRYCRAVLSGATAGKVSINMTKDVKIDA